MLDFSCCAWLRSSCVRVPTALPLGADGMAATLTAAEALPAGPEAGALSAGACWHPPSMAAKRTVEQRRRFGIVWGVSDPAGLSDDSTDMPGGGAICQT